MAEDRRKELRDKLICACDGYDVDESARAMASALSPILIGCTPDRDAARAALDRMCEAMRGHVEQTARPPGTANQ